MNASRILGHRTYKRDLCPSAGGNNEGFRVKRGGCIILLVAGLVVVVLAWTHAIIAFQLCLHLGREKIGQTGDRTHVSVNLVRMSTGTATR